MKNSYHIAYIAKMMAFLFSNTYWYTEDDSFQNVEWISRYVLQWWIQAVKKKEWAHLYRLFKKTFFGRSFI